MYFRGGASKKKTFKEESSSSEENSKKLVFPFFLNFEKCYKNACKHTNRRCVFVDRIKVALMAVAAVALSAGRNFQCIFSCT
jgi:hypothetical protein